MVGNDVLSILLFVSEIVGNPAIVLFKPVPHGVRVGKDLKLLPVIWINHFLLEPVSKLIKVEAFTSIYWVPEG